MAFHNKRQTVLGEVKTYEQIAFLTPTRHVGRDGKAFLKVSVFVNAHALTKGKRNAIPFSQFTYEFTLPLDADLGWGAMYQRLSGLPEFKDATDA